MPFPTAHALLIGIGTYAHAPQLNVPITTADVNAVAAVLRDPHYCGYPPEHVTLLTHANASRIGILAALDGLAAQVGADDTVLVFYAGHGEYGDDGYYLTTHDTRLTGRKVAVGTGLREAELIANLRAITAKRLLLIVNACHAGELSPVLAADEAPLTGNPLPPQAAAALLGTGEGRVIISACRENQYSFIGPGPLTLFTQALVDGLQGRGVGSNRGYISVFDLYTHLYFALDEAVPRTISAAVRQRYGAQQEPELTILKGVGPFAVALYRGATTLGTFDASSNPPESTAVRTVNPAYAQAMLRQHQQTIGDHAQSGATIAGDVHGAVHVTQSDTKHSGVDLSGSTVSGTVEIGQAAGGDIHHTETSHNNSITTGDVQGTGIAIGHGARSSVRTITTGGGDYAEGNIDKRRGTFVSGDQFNMSGNFSGAILNIKSTLTNVSQSIGTAPGGDAGAKAQLQQLIEQLSAELQKVPAEQVGEAEQAAKRAESAVAEATKPNPDKDDVEYSLSRLKKAAENIAGVLPTVLPIATQIADTLRKMIGA
jgi:uncharacterized caspase-like protein